MKTTPRFMRWLASSAFWTIAIGFLSVVAPRGVLNGGVAGEPTASGCTPPTDVTSCGIPSAGARRVLDDYKNNQGKNVVDASDGTHPLWTDLRDDCKNTPYVTDGLMNSRTTLTDGRTGWLFPVNGTLNLSEDQLGPGRYTAHTRLEADGQGNGAGYMPSGDGCIYVEGPTGGLSDPNGKILSAFFIPLTDKHPKMMKLVNIRLCDKNLEYGGPPTQDDSRWHSKDASTMGDPPPCDYLAVRHLTKSFRGPATRSRSKKPGAATLVPSKPFFCWTCGGWCQGFLDM